MGIIDDAKRIKLGDQLMQWGSTVESRLNEIDRMISEMEGRKTEYPADAAEIQSVVDNVKTKLNEVVNKHK